MSDQVYIFTMNQGGKAGRWSRYVFPWTIEHFAHLRDSLYLREGDNVHKVVEGQLFDNGAPFESIIWWPWLDFGQPGVDKTMIGFDISMDGYCDIEIGYDQNDLTAFTTSFRVESDTLPGQMVPMPVGAPTFSPKLTFPGGQAWEWQATQLYVMDSRQTA
jgi:hypothetical protein